MTGFELAVPDGWAHIPTTPEAVRRRDRLIDELIRFHVPDSLPRDKAGPWRRMLRRELTEAAEEAGQAGARGVLLPMRDFNGVRLPGSMVLTVLEDDPEVDAESLLASLLADAGADGSYLEIGGSPAVRVASVVDSERIKRSFPSRRVSYYVSNPDLPGVWGLLVFTVLTDGDVDAEPVEAVVLLFDAVVGTLRWTTREPAGATS